MPTWALTCWASGACRLRLLKVLLCITGHLTSGIRTFSSLTAVHAANVLQHESDLENHGAALSLLDEKYLAELGLLGHVHEWREATLMTKRV